MSELYLDTELNRQDHIRIADTLRSSPYSLGELDQIMFEEVYPVMIPNLWSVAGEWSGFDMPSLESAILARLARRVRVPGFLLPGRRLIRQPWERIKQLIATDED